MKVLLFEFICGGGLAGQPLPDSLAHEGAMMLQALVTELKLLPAVELIILLDRRCKINGLPDHVQIIGIEANQDYVPVLQKLLRECDLFWPIAPETDGMLKSLAELAAAAEVISLVSTPPALQLCASKYTTSRHLNKFYIQTIETEYLTAVSGMNGGKAVIKPDDGVGCEGNFIVTEGKDYQRIVDSCKVSGQYVIQPYVPGRSLSLSCLCKNGRGWLLCCNEQELVVDCNRFCLTACRVNIEETFRVDYQQLVDRIAAAIPGLWGYIGIDVIESDQYGAVILEINPRLTTSYCGIRDATGINVAEQVIRLLDAEPMLRKTDNRTVTVNIHTGIH